jgi:predicted dehydrogenase
MKQIRIGFIGCGGIANAHAERLRSIPEAEIVALCDPLDESMERFVKLNPEAAKVPRFEDDWLKMLDTVEMDAVGIFTPHTLHFEQTMAALDRGLHVLAEKPMVCTSDRARQIIKKLDETGLKLQISYQRHFDPVFQVAREMIANGDIGDLQFVHCHQGQEWLKSQSGTWRQILELSGGGQLNDSGSHLIDIILWVTGLEAESVHAFVDNCGTPVDINSAVNIRFKSGAQGSISVVGSCPVWTEEHTFFGEKGVLNINDGALYLSVPGKDKKVVDLPDSPGEDPDRNFVDAILGEAELVVPATCGLRVIELTESAWESGKTGKCVAVKVGD